MRGSLKSKLIWTLSSLITLALLLGGGMIIWQNVEQMRQEIYLDALSFGELTNDRIITSFEQFYVTENFLQFKKDINPMLSKNSDIKTIQVIGKSSELFYDSDTETEVAYIGEERRQDHDLTRVRDIKPSLLFENGEIVYAKKNAERQWLAVDENEKLLEFPRGEVVNVVYPHKNARLDVVYSISYDALWARIQNMAISILVVIIASIVVVSLFSLYFAGKLVKPIKALEKVVLKVGEGEFGAQAEVMSQDEIGVLAETFNKMSKKLKKDTEELLEKEAIEKELDIARSIQQRMLPEKAPVHKSLQIAGSLAPASAIGGDIYDYLPLDKESSYIFIADVTGHGVPAGMVANTTHATLYSYSKVYESTNEIMAAMNSVVHAKTKPNMFATALLARWSEKTRQLKYCNAGHEEVVYYDSATQKISLIGKGGMALGMMPDITKILKEQELTVKKDDVLVLYTDGIPEAWKTKKENLGMDAFVEIVQRVIAKEKDAEGIRSSILKELTAYRSGYPQQDDITIIVMKGV